MGGATAYVRRSYRDRPTLTAWGPGLAHLLDALLAAGTLDRLAPAWISVPRNDLGLVTERCVIRAGGDWEWMWTGVAPPLQPGEDCLVALDDAADAEEIRRLAAAENPRFEGHPGTGESEVWLGIRDDAGDLLACGAVHRLASGAAHLAGVLVAVRARRAGLGRAVSAALTRWAVDREGVCTLWMYADNDPARRLYHSLGYRTDKEWSSRVLVRVRHPS